MVRLGRNVTLNLGDMGCMLMGRVVALEVDKGRGGGGGGSCCKRSVLPSNNTVQGSKKVLDAKNMLGCTELCSPNSIGCLSRDNLIRVGESAGMRACLDDSYAGRLLEELDELDDELDDELELDEELDELDEDELEDELDELDDDELDDELELELELELEDEELEEDDELDEDDEEGGDSGFHAHIALVYFVHFCAK